MTAILVLAVSLVLAIAGLVLIRRIGDPGPLARGEARWRYRDRARIEGPNRIAASFQLPRRTRGWWVTRMQFGIAVVALVLGHWSLMVQLEPTFGGVRIGLWAMLPIAAYAGMWAGFVWMIRIYRAGLRNDSEATWRYRDRQS